MLGRPASNAHIPQMNKTNTKSPMPHLEEEQCNSVVLFAVKINSSEGLNVPVTLAPATAKVLAMGTHMGLSYACLFVGYVEQSLFRSYTGPIPYLFLRYIDDCIGATSCSHKELEQFINFTNTFHPN
eukprot:g39813.t1